MVGLLGYSKWKLNQSIELKISVVKGEIAPPKLFFFGHNVFKSCLLQRHQKAFNPPTYRWFLMPLHQTTFENNVTKGEIAHHFATVFSAVFNKSTLINLGFFKILPRHFQSGLLEIY